MLKYTFSVMGWWWGICVLILFAVVFKKKVVIEKYTHTLIFIEKYNQDNSSDFDELS